MASDLFTWRFGTPAQREIGGIPAFLVGDSVLPYTTPDPLPAYWAYVPETDPAVPFGGQFDLDPQLDVPRQGWQRNLFAGAGGAKNFPANRFPFVAPYVMVVPAMIGLKDSATAPQRITVANPNDAAFPFDGFFTEGLDPEDIETGGALRFLFYYVENYLEDDTMIIPMIPERELMNFLGDETDPFRLFDPAPINATGRASIVRYVQMLLAEFNTRIAGWYLIDEPDDTNLNRQAFAPPEQLATVYELIKQTEIEWRSNPLNDPIFAAAAAASDVALMELLRHPIIITLTQEFAVTRGNRIVPHQPEEYVNSRCADIIMFDRYPTRRTMEDLANDYQTCLVTRDLGEDEQLTQPTKTMRILGELRRRINPNGLQPPDPGYTAVLNWAQSDGSPFHASDDEADAKFSPAFLDPVTGDDCLDPAVAFRRRKLLPGIDVVRADFWASLFQGSEGFALFSQTGLPDRDFLERFVPVAREFLFFASARSLATRPSNPPTFLPGNRNNEVTRIAQTYSPPEACDAREGNDRPIWFYFALPPPVIPFPEGQYPIDTENTNWFLVINRKPQKLDITFEFARARTDVKPNAPRVFEEWRFMTPLFKVFKNVDTGLDEFEVIRIPTNDSGQASFSVEGYSIRIFRSLPKGWPPPDPPG